ncbi:MAG: hypothetical protein QXX01_02785 [Candidatus Aenigmatarchaeota archaeon]|nr:hypothetical protein [Candidatus Aenigmarchaeota archaeon]
MKKGLSNLVILILLVLLSILLVSQVYVWSQSSLKLSYPEKLTDKYLTIRGCIHILDANKTSILIKNCGLTTIKNGAVYINYIKKAEFSREIEPQKSIWINYNEQIESGTYSFIVVADVATSPEFKLTV